ncbi:MAG: hypothetical protein MJ198_03720 [Bacteroidales bacterium]|nr:hypothetical protein [Bacteroidales bacterium]
MDNQKFNKTFKVGYVALLVVALLATVWYWVAAAGKDCLACSLSVCEGVTPDGESYLMSADSCAVSYAEIMEREAQQGIDITECSQECLDYTGAYLWFAIALIIIAVVLMLALAVYSSFTNGKKLSKTTLVTAGFVVVVLAIAIAIAVSTVVIPNIIGYEQTITELEVELTDTMLYGTYFILAGAVLAICSSFVIKFLRK